MKVTQTCSACPSQWTVELDDSRSLYVRYRWGWLSVAETGDEGHPFEQVQLGDRLDGVMETNEMLVHLRIFGLITIWPPTSWPPS